MSKFHYCHSKDELDWHADVAAMSSFLSLADIDLHKKEAIRKWIEEFCTDNVYVLPMGGAVFYFQNPADSTMFILRWK